MLTKRLAGGNVANIGDFPWMVILNHLGKFRRVYSCGGTIISSRWILTACHCIKRSPQRFLVVMGEVDKKGINFDFYEGDGLSMIATETIVHPRYRISAKNDIGLLLLPYEITFNGKSTLSLFTYQYFCEIFSSSIKNVWYENIPNPKYDSIRISLLRDIRRIWINSTVLKI